MTDVHILRVFCGPGLTAGNPLGVVLDGDRVPQHQRQKVAADLAFSETVFVEDLSEALLDIYTPGTRLAFAGAPLVGAAWLLRREVHALEILRPPAGEARTRGEDDFSWIAADPDWAAGRKTHQLAEASQVAALAVPPPGQGFLYAWAWLDEPGGIVRARGFPGRGDGADEDEATGAAAIVLAAELGRPLDIRQGKGSQILVTPLADGTIEVGGRVVEDEVRRLDI